MITFVALTRPARLFCPVSNIILFSFPLLLAAPSPVDILRGMDHPNIVKAHELYTYKKHIFLVLELCDGGDLYTRSPYSERESARHVASLLSAIKYMHGHNIVHRDLKFENIMFEDSRPDAVIKVIDFGLSKKFLGQPGYMTERGTYCNFRSNRVVT
jgi:serine/threonine protein kinase